MRLILAAFLAFWTPLAQAVEPFDALSHLLRNYAGPVDEKAAAAAPETDVPPETGARLAQIQADLSLMAEGFEAFRHPSHARRALQDLPDHIIPELRPFFKDRDSALDTVYRTLAVTDYTWALRFPEPTCDPQTRRKILLSSKDGLFTDVKSGGLSPWLARLLGPSTDGSTAAEALDRASSKHALAPRDYELVRVKVVKITEALTSDKAVGKERAKLYCLRADAYETLASAHQAVKGGLVQASHGTDAANPPNKESASVLLIAVEEGPKRYRAVGAGVVVETALGRKVLTAAHLTRAGGEDKPALRGFIRTRDETLGKPHEIVVERMDLGTGIMVGRLEEDAGIHALKISHETVARQDLVRAIGHMSAGAWTVSQGLVTATGTGTFASDAILGADMLGSPLLNDAGEVVGLVVLSPLDGTPSAVMPEYLRQLAEGNGPLAASSDIQFIASRQTGSGSILTAAAPIAIPASASDGGLVEASYIYSQTPYGTVRGRCMNCTGAPQSSYSSGSSGGAEIGQALGQAMAPLVEALIFKGIPALFRGIGSLFNAKPKVSPPIRRRESVQERPREIEKPKEPPKLTGLKLALSPTEALEGETVTATVTMLFSGDNPRKDGITVTLSNGTKGKVVFPFGNSGVTNASGQAVIVFEIDASDHDRELPFDELKQEERRRAGEEPISQVQPQRKAKNEFDRVKTKMPDRFQGLDDEETRAEHTEAPSDHESAAEPASDSLIQAAMLTAPIPAAPDVLYSMKLSARAVPAGRLVALGAKLDDEKKIDIQSRVCPVGSVAAFALKPANVSPGEAARPDIVEAIDRSDCLKLMRVAREKCQANGIECIEGKLIESGYYRKKCSAFEQQDEQRGKPSPASPPILNLQRPKARSPIVCLPKGSSSSDSKVGKNGSYQSEDKKPLSPEGRALVDANPDGSALKPDIYHRAAAWFREFAAHFGQHFSINGQDTLTQVSGELNGIKGRYEYIVTPAGTLTHSRFVAGGTINGKVNTP